MEALILIVVVVFIWDGIMGEGSFMTTGAIGATCYFMGQFLKWVGLNPELSNYITIGLFLTCVVWIHLADRKDRLEKEKDWKMKISPKKMV